MEVIFGNEHYGYACLELAQGLSDAIPTIRRVAEEFRTHPSYKRLYVRLACDCCTRLHGFQWDTDIVVSPLCGSAITQSIEEVVEVYPPYQSRDKRYQAASLEEFGDEFRKLIERRLASKDWDGGGGR